MRSVSFIGIAITLGLMTTACEGERGCVERVLREDSHAAQAGSPAAVLSQMRAIEMSACPVDFRDAYFTHIQAWDQKSRLAPAAAAVNKPAEGFWDGVGKTVAGAVVGLAEVQASEEIKQSFRQVERVAVRHGAALSH
jgi:hypothetical protein